MCRVSMLLACHIAAIGQRVYQRLPEGGQVGRIDQGHNRLWLPLRRVKLRAAGDMPAHWRMTTCKLTDDALHPLLLRGRPFVGIPRYASVQCNSLAGSPPGIAS